jgi:recombination protein RecT
MKEKSKNQKTDLALMKRDVVDVVTQRIGQLVGDGKLHLPADYSAENALMAAWLKLQSTVDKDKRPALDVCTKDSIANALLDLIVQGLTPAKDQCYFVVYGDKLVCLRSYFGDEALLKRVYPEARVYAEPIYQGDELEYEIQRGRKRITKHKQKFGSVGDLNTIVGAYAVVEPGDGHEPHCEIMTIDQIKKAWSRGENWPPRQGKMSAHTDHPEEFVKKTVIARACKRMINSSNDSYLVRAVERQAHLAAETEMEARVAEEANKEIIDLPPEGDEAHILSEQEHRELDDVVEGKQEEESPSSPSARFGDFIQEHDLNPTKARKMAASIRKLKDVRNLGNDDFAKVLNNADAFLACYRQQYGGGKGQESFAGPGF